MDSVFVGSHDISLSMACAKKGTGINKRKQHHQLVLFSVPL